MMMTEEKPMPDQFTPCTHCGRQVHWRDAWMPMPENERQEMLAGEPEPEKTPNDIAYEAARGDGIICPDCGERLRRKFFPEEFEHPLSRGVGMFPLMPELARAVDEYESAREQLHDIVLAAMPPEQRAELAKLRADGWEVEVGLSLVSADEPFPPPLVTMEVYRERRGYLYAVFGLPREPVAPEPVAA
jgi:hypothetical protein